MNKRPRGTSRNSRIAVIGTGKIGEALVSGLLESGFVNPDQIVATTLHSETAASLSKRLPITVSTDNRKAVGQAQVVVLAMKPKQVGLVCDEIGPHLPKNALVISLATGVPTGFIEARLAGKSAVIRAMPNTPIAIRKGMTVLCPGAHVKSTQMSNARALFETVGETVVVEEDLMNAATGLSASGPAYIYVILESLAEAGVKVGLPRDLATRLAAQTTLGASSMVLSSGRHPALLKDNVTTPAGVTIDGLMELEEGGLRVALIKAIMMSTRRASEIQEQLLKTLANEKRPAPRAAK